MARLVSRLVLVIGLVLGGLLVPGAVPSTLPAGNPAAAVGLEVESPAPRPDAQLVAWRPDAPDRAARDAAIAVSLGATQVAAGHLHTCALTLAGGVKCWGDNEYGKLGNGSTTDSATPVGVVRMTSGVASVSAGRDHTCAVTLEGGVACWGLNNDGQLGYGVVGSSSTPLDVVGPLSGVADVSAGDYHTCARMSAGGVKCWGQNTYGQLGNGNTNDSTAPVAVGGLTGTVTSVSAGRYHTCAVKSGGEVKCWGQNTAGQLGNEAYTIWSTPVVVHLTIGVSSVSAGGYHTCAVTSEDGVKCWGSNALGQLGYEGVGGSAMPVDVVGLPSGVASVSAGYDHTCAVTLAGGVKCWGSNAVGQLGDGKMPTSSTTPVDVFGLTGGVSDVSAGYAHTCAVATSTGGVKCWGDNYNGALGDRTMTNRATPVYVVGFEGIFYSISGRVTDGADAGLAGVTVTADSTHYATTATTAADGTYSIAGLPAGTYTLTPSYTDPQYRDRTFSPASYNVTISMSSGSVTGKDFRLVELYQRVYLPFVTKP